MLETLISDHSSGQMENNWPRWFERPLRSVAQIKLRLEMETSRWSY